MIRVSFLCIALGWTMATAVAQSSAPTMNAIVVHEYGGPEVLKYEDAPRPEPKDDEILIRTIAPGFSAPVNFRSFLEWMSPE